MTRRQSSRKGVRQKFKPISIVGDVAFVPLTQGKVATIDAADVHLVEKLNWVAMKDKWGHYYAAAPDLETGRKVRMHRVISGAAAGTLVDHADLDTLNNRRSNIRPCSNSQNQANKRQNKNNKVGVKGVCKYRNRYHAQITFNHKRIHLGFWDSPEEAGAAYAQMARELFGAFARTV